MKGGYGLLAGGYPWELMGRDTHFLEAPAHSFTWAQTRTETRCGVRKLGATAQLRCPSAAWGNNPGWSRTLQGLPSSWGLLPPGDWTLSLTHYKQRANFCLAPGKGRTKTRHTHHFESLVMFEWVNMNKCAVIPLCAWESRQKAGLEHAYRRYAQTPKNKRL